MSRFFEFLQKLNGQNTDPLSATEGASEDIGRTPELRQILSILQLPRNTGSSKDNEQSSELKHIRIHEVHIQPADRLVFHTDSSSPAADRFRLLRMRLRELWKAGKLKTLLVTSPLPHDGKSTISLNLATALAERGRRAVLLIDADLHHSSVSEQLGLKTQAGLRECLDSGLNPLSAIRRVLPLECYVLPAGEPPGNPTELLQAEALSGVLQKLSSCFDWIVIDSPPVLPLTDSISLMHQADASLLVARAGSTPSKAIEDTIALLGRKHVLGIVLNGVAETNGGYSKYYGYYGNKRLKNKGMEKQNDSARQPPIQAQGSKTDPV